jgi:hypothetical protein
MLLYENWPEFVKKWFQLVTGHWLLATGHWSLVPCFWLLVACFEGTGGGSIKAHSKKLAGWEAIMLGGGTIEIE